LALVSRRDFVRLSLAAGSAAAFGAAPPLGAERPNIVFILADDLGINDVSVYGQKKFPTPHIDSLASAGMRFTDAYAGAPVCAPSRCALMTGLNIGHARVRGNFALAGGLVGNKGKESVRRANITPADRTVADYLKGAGYHTGLVGKWHLDGYDPGATPTDHGFDEFKGWLVQNGKSQGYFSTEWYNGKEVVAVHENDDGRQGRYETELSPHCAHQLSGIPDLRRIIFFRGWSKSPTGFKPLETRVPLTSPLPDRHLKPTSIVLGEEKHNVPQN
jgi:arylsulfatase A-like enzyme